MNENLDLTEILKDCPEGTEFYSSIYGNVKFKRINKEDIKHPIEFYTLNDYHDAAADGRHLYMFDGECTFFPSKDQRDWSKWQRPFVDGDIVYYDKFVSIFKKWGDSTLFYSHISIEVNSGETKDRCFGKFIRKESRFATEEEKTKLFQVIKDNGYKWNVEEKKLEKLIVPKFKVGDKVRNKANGRMTGTIFALYEEVYEVKNPLGNEFSIDFISQDNYELLPNKFDPKTLQPFDKVLARDSEEQSWEACIYSHMNECENYPFTASLIKWRYCIPYNNDTKHLVGKIDEAPEFYRYW